MNKISYILFFGGVTKSLQSGVYLTQDISILTSHISSSQVFSL